MQRFEPQNAGDLQNAKVRESKASYPKASISNIPRPSMYGILTYIHPHVYDPNESNSATHGWFGRPTLRPTPSTRVAQLFDW